MTRIQHHPHVAASAKASQNAPVRVAQVPDTTALPPFIDPDLMGGPSLRGVLQLPPPRVRRPLTPQERRQIDDKAERNRLERERVELARQRELERRRTER